MIQIKGRLGHRRARHDATILRHFACFFSVFAAFAVWRLDRRRLIDRHHRVVDEQKPLSKLRALWRRERLDVHHEDLQVLSDLEQRIKGLLLRLAWRCCPQRHAVDHMVRHVLRDLGVDPVAVHALRRDDQRSINAALIVEHGNVIDEHEALASAHVREQGGDLMVPEPLKIRGLMRERLVFKPISL